MKCLTCPNEVVRLSHKGPMPRYCLKCRPRSKPQSADLLPRRSRYFTLAHAYVSTAIYNGDLPKLDGSIACVDCGVPACEYDHRDYKKPMEVEPVCRACNQARGPGLHRDPSETGKKPPTIVQRFRARERAA